jgi:hypothetical protein
LNAIPCGASKIASGNGLAGKPRSHDIPRANTRAVAAS